MCYIWCPDPGFHSQQRHLLSSRRPVLRRHRGHQSLSVSRVATEFNSRRQYQESSSVSRVVTYVIGHRSCLVSSHISSVVSRVVTHVIAHRLCLVSSHMSSVVSRVATGIIGHRRCQQSLTISHLIQVSSNCVL